MNWPDSPASAINLSLRVVDFMRLSNDAREPDSEAKPRRQATLPADDNFTGWHLASDAACCLTTAPAADANDGANRVNRNAYISKMCFKNYVSPKHRKKYTLVINWCYLFIHLATSILWHCNTGWYNDKIMPITHSHNSHFVHVQDNYMHMCFTSNW